MKRDIKQKICVFISSSDNTKDVLFYTYQSFCKYWSDCPFEIFIGTNSSINYVDKSINQIFTKNIKNWRSELYNQITNLPSNYDFVILFLDDFFLTKKVNNFYTERIIEEAINSNADYTRFKPRLTSVFGKLINKIYPSDNTFEQLNTTEPYFSSLQVALWKRNYLTNRLSNNGNIWEFEHEITNAVHQVVIKSIPFDYIHVVEKGKWNFYAKSVINKAGISFYSGKREVLGLSYALFYLYKEFLFMLIGYSYFKFKFRLNEIFNNNTCL